MKDFLIALAAAVIASSLSIAFGDDASRSVVKVVTRYKVCTVDPWTRQQSCRVDQAAASGVVVGEKDGRRIVATCYHVVREVCKDRTNGVWLELNGQFVKATPMCWEESDDVALLSIDSNLPTLEIDDDPSPGDPVEAVGFPAGRFQLVRQRVRSRDVTRGDIWGDHSISQGHSGGGLIRAGRLAGLLRGTQSRGDGSLSVSVVRVRRLMDWAKIRYRYRGRVINADVIVAPVPPPPTIPPATPAPSPTPVVPMGQQGAKGDKGDKGDQGPQGIQGEPGPQGPIGPAAIASINIAAIEARLKTLEERGITVQLIDGDGKVIGEQTYAPGKPIKIQFQGK